MKLIKLSQRNPWAKPLFTTVDDEDFEMLNHYSWYAIKRPGTTHAATDQITGRCIYMHQLLLPSPHPSLTPDHKNNDGLDNRRDNLRLATKAQQATNAPKRNMQTSSEYKGVCFSKRENKWKAYIDDNGRRHLGTFISETAAAKAYNQAAVALHGEFASLNQIRECN